MRNIIKKLLSLLLVGVVAVSMFVFITPIHVNATEANALDKGILFVTIFLSLSLLKKE